MGQGLRLGQQSDDIDKGVTNSFVSDHLSLISSGLQIPAKKLTLDTQPVIFSRRDQGSGENGEVRRQQRAGERVLAVSESV